MKPLILSIAILSLAACGPRTRLNPGADLPVYSAEPGWIWENLPHRYGQRILGFYDPSDGSITIDSTLSPWCRATTFLHEAGHAYDHQKPADLWELMARYHAPGFVLLTHPQEEIDLGRAYMDTVPDPLEVKRAMDAAKEAAR